jgi:hypothetical protein
MSSVNVLRSLSDYRLEKAQRRLERRLSNAQTVFSGTGNFKTMYLLKYKAIHDFLAAVPELRDITQEAKREFIKRTLSYAGPAGGQDATISHAISAIRQKKRRSLLQLLRASSGEG